MSTRAARRQRRLPSATIEFRGVWWVRVGGFFVRWAPLPLRWKLWLLNKFITPRFQMRTGIGTKMSEWFMVGVEVSEAGEASNQ